MNLFRSSGKGDRKIPRAFEQSELAFDTVVPATATATLNGHAPSQRGTGRTEVYAVRVRGTFKGEVMCAAAELQLERQRANPRARKVTEGELMELMLETFKAARRNGDVNAHAAPLADDVWRGAHELARRQKMTPSEVVERLIVGKIAELGILSRA